MSLLAQLATIDDPRRDINKKHALLDILFLTVSAVLSGAEGWKDIKEFGDEKLDWLRQYRPFGNGIPVDDTIARVVRAIDPTQFNRAFIAWVNEVRRAQGQEQIALNGKTLRRSHDGEKQAALHSITAWGHECGLVLAQMKSSGKKNEQASVMEMLELLQVDGAHITADAMNTQKKIARKIHEKGGDYTLSLKDNHKTFQREIQAYFHKVTRDDPDRVAVYEEVDGGHGRVERRTCRQLPVSDWVSEAAKWPGLQTVIEMERERHLPGQAVETETHYYISSLPVDAVRVARGIRQHWEVENKAHWVLDVAFKEDDCRIRKGDGAENVAIIRRFCLNLARLHPHKNSMRGKLKQAGWSDTKRAEILFGQAG
ncbi:MAG: ISAs1 family transposase [Gammaproteobacteria bacterium]|nr:ISAs1 family transposase [Gammaproteobacteria bacterium]